MSAARTTGLLLRLYPSEWRDRYGEELENLIVESTGGRTVPWRMRVDVALAGGRERLHAAGLSGDGAPDERVRSGSLLVLWAWVLFVVAGTVVQKLSEHWQDATPAAGRGLPAGAFLALMVAAAVGSVLVLAGIAAATPSLVAYLRGGGWPAIRRRVVTAALLSVVAVAATIGVVVWAHGLTAQQRSGHDLAYGSAFVAWALLLAACLVAWTVAAVAVARRLTLSAATLRLEAGIASTATLAMGAMTVATAIWWAALAHTAPWFLAGKPVGSSASALSPTLLVATLAMLVASVLGALGASRALQALPMLVRP